MDITFVDSRFTIHQSQITMFNRKRQRIMEMMSGYQPTSKSGLKQYCLRAANGDVRQAGEIYDYFIKDMGDLPMFDPVPPTFMDNAKDTVTGIFNFVQENKEGIGQVADIVRTILGKRGVAAPSEPLPPIN